MNSSPNKYEGWLYGLAFLIAIALRFIQLGAAPLTDSEATLALQALHLAQGKSEILAPQPAYILLTSLFFLVIESTNFMARVVPTLVGSALVFAPYFFRDKLGARPALILAFLFAIDPGLVALSRQSNGTILAVAFLIFAWGLWINRRETAAGIFLGLALLSGPSVWSGVLTLLLTWVFLRGMNLRPTADQAMALQQSQDVISNSPVSNSLFANHDVRNTLLALLSTVLLAGTLFFTVPNGLSAVFASLPAYFTGWMTPSTSTAARTLFTFIAYEVLGISLAVFALVRGFRTGSKRIIRLSLWLGVALLLAVFYRQADELAWAILPLLALAAMELSRAFDVYREELVEAGVMVFVIFILMVYIWFNISGLALNPAAVPTTVPILGTVQDARAFVLYGLISILIVGFALVAFGWSMRMARLGATWSFAIFFGLYSLGVAWGASGLRNPGGVELWLAESARPLQADLLRASVDDISEFSMGHINAQPVTIYGVSSPALEWLLRDNDVTVVSTLDPQMAPPIVITTVMNDLGLPAAYRGQDFTWRQTPQWAVVQNHDWVTWLVFRKLPLERETILLWARDDLFPDARGSQP
ncbi:MAG TPA: hypothetical protein VFR47_31440 [Anaerolineales bacterium]|nr:hypothetical protein [Anaerolineales bacterium]